ncbi:hypothetical protein L9W92_08935 [Pelotomaculum terephthalicicum JT]|uniref:hypothetical protein n=1 Tax=Pelotomaculum TaxID=191373 RepID=UPI0009D4D740|nr:MULTISPECIES: hypothetical protein [Pelotomaculum]MCG9968174.1 hypothetical protein [Pelotomaculum terephthalicicum JT]OPX83930.1 MAG: hypothetical protein A4E54_02895 [Pelotomaculum sp. PtaB.Bin117]OPY63193.1 MAG: hypothetical protein A4E56_00787 [Pelotomaculum sp. PtaU1.Bin065]
MQWQGLKIPVIIFSLLAGLVVIFGVQWIYQKYSIQNPINMVLSGNEAVESYNVSTEGKQIKITLTFKDTADLMQSYNELQKELDPKMGQRSYQLLLKDSRDDSLQQVWYNSQFAVYQAIAQGSYRSMAEEIKQEAAAAGVEAKINIDQKNIYIRLKKDGRTLDEVVARDGGQSNGNIKAPLVGGGTNAQGN